jgi:hypothetical protein
VSNELSNYGSANRQPHLDDPGSFGAPGIWIDAHPACFTPKRSLVRTQYRPLPSSLVRRYFRNQLPVSCPLSAHFGLISKARRAQPPSAASGAFAPLSSGSTVDSGSSSGAFAPRSRSSASGPSGPRGSGSTAGPASFAGPPGPWRSGQPPPELLAERVQIAQVLPRTSVRRGAGWRGGDPC